MSTHPSLIVCIYVRFDVIACWHWLVRAGVCVLVGTGARARVCSLVVVCERALLVVRLADPLHGLTLPTCQSVTSVNISLDVGVNLCNGCGMEASERERPVGVHIVTRSGRILVPTVVDGLVVDWREWTGEHDG